MTPKEKAIDLVDKFNQYTVKASTHYPNGKMVECKDDAKRCAYIAVNEMIAFAKHAFSYINIELATPSIVYLEEVKQELEKL